MFNTVSFKYLFLFCITSAGGSVLQAQAQGDDFNRLRVTAQPTLTMVSNIKFGVQAGVFYTGAHWGGGMEVGGPIPKGSLGFSNTHYTRFGAEVRRRALPKDHFRYYVSLQATYANRAFTAVDGGSFFVRDGTDKYSYSKARIQSPIATLAPKFGLEITPGRRVFIDAFAGLGVRRIYTRYSNIENLSSASTGWFGHIGPIASHRYNRTVTGWHLPWGVRMGYIIK